MAIIYQTDVQARKSLLSGVEQLAKLVTITMGPKGRNVALDRLWHPPVILHDGVSVAKEIDLSDEFENMGAQLVKEAAEKTNDKAGDGTTTATLLAWKLVERGFRLIDQHVNPQILKDGMFQAVKDVAEELQANSRQLSDADVKAVATISAASEEIGDLIAEAVGKVGQDGVITVEEGMGYETTIEYKEGMSFDKGFGGPLFVTNENEQIAELDNPYILFTDMDIVSMQDLADFLDNILDQEHRKIVIIANLVDGWAMKTLAENIKRGTIQCICIPTPSFGFKRLWMLEDMATLTGGTVITRQSGRTLASVTQEELGTCERVWCDSDNTKIIGGKGDPEAIKARIEGLKGQVEKQESEFEQRQLQQRIAKLSGGVATLKVGAVSEVELKERKERVVDAVEATKAAVAEGIVAGGGIALLYAQEKLRENEKVALSSDYEEGYRLVLDVLHEPFVKILTNAGRNWETVAEKVEAQTYHEADQIARRKPNYGYNVMTEQFGDMFQMGVIDPLRVTKQALVNAVSVAAMILTTEGLVSKKHEDTLSPLEKQLLNTPN